jgi:hypothetical protein
MGVVQAHYHRRKGRPAKDIKLTTISVKTTEIKLSNLQAGKTSKASFTLKNTGKQPLLINSVDASCGCTVPSWEKQPVKSGETAKIDVEVTPTSAGYFHKTITVYCNIADNFVILSLKGTVTE